ncbi:MAG: UUP1 family membrane protein, partial [Gammaproteobacteria bacterium]
FDYFMTKRFVGLLAAALTMIGLGTFAYKVLSLGYPVTRSEMVDVWTVETRISFEGGAGSVKVTMELPTLTPGFTILPQENFISPGFGFDTAYTAAGREAVWAVRRAEGRQTIYYRAQVYKDPAALQQDTTPTLPPVPELDEIYDSAMRALVAEVRTQSADDATFTAELLRRLNDPSPDQNAALFLSQVNNQTERAQAAATLLAGNRIPSRVVRGIYLQDQQRDARPVPWLEIHDGDRWRYFNPANGEQGRPDDFLFWWRGTQPLVHVEGGTDTEVRLAVQRNVVSAMDIAEARADRARSAIASFSPLALPIQTQAVYSVLLLIPVGTLLIVLFRNVIGIQSFGTFMPVLIALAFRETRLLSGLMLFTLLVGLGLTIRFYLDRLRLLLVPRLASVLTAVVLLMLCISIVGSALDMEIGLSVALFPMVILTMVIERMSVVWEERGAADALQQGAGSLLMASLCYLVMGLDAVEHLVFVFPELLLVLLAITLLLGRYTGYRLTEFIRFRALISK